MVGGNEQGGSDEKEEWRSHKRHPRGKCHSGTRPRPRTSHRLHPHSRSLQQSDVSGGTQCMVQCPWPRRTGQPLVRDTRWQLPATHRASARGIPWPASRRTTRARGAHQRKRPRLSCHNQCAGSARACGPQTPPEPPPCRRQQMHGRTDACVVRAGVMSGSACTRAGITVQV